MIGHMQMNVSRRNEEIDILVTEYSCGKKKGRAITYLGNKTKWSVY